jgi:dihydrofolate reductase
MRTVTYGAARSVDGYIAGSGGALDWLHFSQDVAEVLAGYWSTVDTVLMGRKTWEFAAAQGTGGESASNEGTGIPEVATYIFSRTLTEPPPGVKLVPADAVGFVRQLKEQPGMGICLMGGAELASPFFEAGIIDQISLNVHPVLLGSGAPFFPPQPRRTTLELEESRILSGGWVLMNYRVRH